MPKRTEPDDQAWADAHSQSPDQRMGAKVTLHLDYSMGPAGKAADVDFASTERIDFSYRYLYGHVTFLVGELDLSARGIPVIDFADCIDAVVRGLGGPDGVEGTFHHTESQDSITFCRMDDSVQIESNYAIGTATMDYGELRAATNQFLLTVLRGLTGRQWQGTSLVRPYSGLHLNRYVVESLSAAMGRSAEQPLSLNAEQIEEKLIDPDYTVKETLVNEFAGRSNPESRRVQWRLLFDEDRAVIEAMAETLLVMADVDSVALLCRALRVWGETDDEGVWQTIAWSMKAPLDFQLFDVAGVLREVAAGEPGDAREGALDALDWLGLSTEL